MDWIILIPIFGIVFGIACGGLAIWTDHKKDMALIEKGLYQPKPSIPLSQAILLPGFILTGIGVGAAIGSIWIVADWAVWLRFGGLVLALLGIAMIAFFIATREKKAAP